MHLVENWKQSWRWISMRAFALSTAISVTWVSLPADIKAMIPDSWEKWVFISLAAVSVIGGIGRVVDQSKDKAP